MMRKLAAGLGTALLALITLLRQVTAGPADVPLGAHRLVPMRAGGTLTWSLSAG